MAQDRGAVDDNLAIPMVRIYYAPTMEQKASLDQLLADQRNQESSRYHAWLTPEEFGSRFGISPDDETRIRTWLASQGFSGVQLSRSRTAFTFSTNAGAAARAFAAPIHAVALGGALHHSNVSEIVVPDEVSSLVLRVSGLDDFHPRSQAHHVTPQYSGGSGLYAIAPGDVATMYDLNSLYANGINGSGITLVQDRIFQR
jgi:subtilase family serine protease